MPHANPLLRPFLAAALLLLLPLAGCGAPAQLGPGDRERVAGRTFVVTGASSGLGRGVAVRLGSYGAKVVLAARRAAVLEEVAGDVRAAGGQALVVPTDVSRPEEVERLAAAAVERFGRIDVWINDAGVGVIGRFEEVPVEDHARVVDVNLKGVIFGSHAALRQFRRQGAGTLVNIASVEGRVPLAYHASYAATKHAVVGLGVTLNQELWLNGPAGIRVATVEPWAVDTPFWEHAANRSGGSPRAYRMDGAEEVVDAIVWVSLHPRVEYAVGWKAEGAVFGHRVWPRLTENLAGDMAHGAQVETAPPAPSTAGSLHQPMNGGSAVEGGARERMERENAARRESGAR
ncbi:SDR family NAD(P)-dependent oxidoreductase [Roseomonas sp. BN140053]|uniref:SDR family NAD(P)-dependent oxidoreductase n=1 Tax=Roseomonas sp. BN140053 TaxID=3391898 RepID=UPI0039E916C3